ncbi:putative N-acetylglucosamine-6-sulfatase [Apostichopus japonicus]|uniref:Putative N-acetylglucosamine-6-sulfatase n=1 Tax=Stichopus japonicus TaxID=307972 RepID=A0A2G8LEV8_STIJA|nr:putative N-acetylglucosamine-6-sulfatase [Apostichopus japonicus]
MKQWIDIKACLHCGADVIVNLALKERHSRLTSYRAELMEFGLVHILLGLVSFLLFLDGCHSQKKAFPKDQSDKKPNIIFILTDDQDVTMNGITPMKQTQKLIGDAGMTFTNMFASTPICCPSRSSILTGNYIHNHNAVNNTIQGHCSSTEWQNGPEKNTFAAHLKAENYTTFFAGKYLNQVSGRKSVLVNNTA